MKGYFVIGVLAVAVTTSVACGEPSPTPTPAPELAVASTAIPTTPPTATDAAGPAATLSAAAPAPVPASAPALAPAPAPAPAPVRAPPPNRIDPFIEQAKLTATDAAAGDAIGSSVAVSGDTAVVGAFAAELPGSILAGAAYVFVRNGTTWSQQQKLTASDAVQADAFGSSVVVSGDTIVVGARTARPDGIQNAGAAYVFVRNGTTWSQQQKLTASDAKALRAFAGSVAINEDTLIATAARAGTYVFVRNGNVWSQQQRFTASDAAPGVKFGPVAISLDTTIVGVLAADLPGAGDAGAAYVSAISLAPPRSRSDYRQQHDQW